MEGENREDRKLGSRFLDWKRCIQPTTHISESKYQWSQRHRNATFADTTTVTTIPTTHDIWGVFGQAIDAAIRNSQNNWRQPQYQRQSPQYQRQSPQYQQQYRPQSNSNYRPQTNTVPEPSEPCGTHCQRLSRRPMPIPCAGASFGLVPPDQAQQLIASVNNSAIAQLDDNRKFQNTVVDDFVAMLPMTPDQRMKLADAIKSGDAATVNALLPSAGASPVLRDRADKLTQWFSSFNELDAAVRGGKRADEIAPLIARVKQLNGLSPSR